MSISFELAGDVVNIPNFLVLSNVLEAHEVEQGEEPPHKYIRSEVNFIRFIAFGIYNVPITICELGLVTVFEVLFQVLLGHNQSISPNAREQRSNQQPTPIHIISYN